MSRLTRCEEGGEARLKVLSLPKLEDTRKKASCSTSLKNVLFGAEHCKQSLSSEILSYSTHQFIAVMLICQCEPFAS